MKNSKNYTFSPIAGFIIVGLVLLLGVIITHDAINRGFGPSGWLHQKIFAAGTTKTTTPPPDYVVDEVIQSGINIAGATIESCATRPSMVSRLICEQNFYSAASSFLTQE